MQGTPSTMQQNPKYKDVLLDIYDFFEKNIQGRLKNNNLIIDPGIGFGKTLKHNLTLISKISLFHSLGCQYWLEHQEEGLLARYQKI